MIRLVTVIGHGVNLLPHFIKHYESIVDEIHIVVYESDVSPNILNEVGEIVKNNKRVSIVKVIRDRVFDWEKVTFLYNLVKSEYPDDWWVVADIDEFHLYPGDNIQDLINQCVLNRWELVRGGFIDRIGDNGGFTTITPRKSIWKQFPNAGFFRYPMSNACPNKVCIMKGHVEITAGQHYAKINDHTTWRWQGWNHPLIAPYKDYSVQVHHFKWDSTSIERMLDVANVKKDYSFSNEYMVMYNELRKCNFKIDLHNEDYMFETTYGTGKFYEYRQWNKLIQKIVSI